jgi:hypothetical protein
MDCLAIREKGTASGVVPIIKAPSSKHTPRCCVCDRNAVYKASKQCLCWEHAFLKKTYKKI